MRINKQVLRFLKEESGQTTTEYVLILAVVITMIMQFRGKVLKMLSKILGILDDKTEVVMEYEGDEP